MKSKSSLPKNMGNCLKKNTAHVGVYESPSLDEICPDLSDEMDLSADNNINYNFHIYLYQQYMQRNEGELVTWCASKLALTEDIIRINRSRLRPSVSSENDSANEHIINEIEQLEEYRKKLIKLVKHLKKMDSKKIAHKRLRTKRSHRCAIQLISALTDAVAKV